MVLDSSSTECVVSVYNAVEGEFHERRSTGCNKHAESLFSLIGAALLDSGIDYADIAHIAVVVGPGSFTGLRVSLSAAMGLKLSSSVAVHGISLLELQAHLIRDRSPISTVDKNIMSIVEVAKSGSVYAQVFSKTLVPITAANLTEKDDLETESYFTKYSCKLPDNISSLEVARYLMYKLEGNLPDTPLSPIYSRSYA